MSEVATGPGAGRLVSLDAYRGFVMLAMASAGLGLARLTSGVDQGPALEFLAFHAEHVTWRGCSFWDLIQPSFLFIVGVALPFADARRAAAGQPWRTRFRHALGRSAVLVALGVFLASNWSPRTEFVFTNVLAQIGLGYPVVYLLHDRRPRTILAVVAAILVGYWAWFALYTPPATLSVPTLPLWARLHGLAAHWSPHSNPAAAFDRWFLNLFPRPDGRPYRFNPGGYQTLNFVPSIATMLVGVVAGQWLRSDRSPRAKVVGLALAGAGCLVAGTLLDETVCPVVKRIWTPSWVVYSSAWTLWLLAAFYHVIDVRGHRAWAFPLVVVGLNSIAMYLMAQLLKPWVKKTLVTHVGTLFGWLRDRFGLPLSQEVFVGWRAPVYESASVLLVLWLFCYWLYRRRIFLRI